MQAEGPLIAALDVGTSSLRAMLYSADGRAVPGAHASEGTPLRVTADGGAEVDAEALLEAALRCLTALRERAAGLVGRVAGVGVSTFWHSLLAVDDSGRPLTPIYTWADARAAPFAAQLRRRLDERAAHARTGCLFHASYWPARLAWLRATQPDLFRRATRWLSPGEYLFERLFGAPFCSLCMASGTGLLDQNRLDWDDELLAAVGVDRRQLSPLVERDLPARGVLRPWREALGPLAEVPWFPALGDGACNNVGAGCLGRERIALMIGTSGAMRVLSQAPRAEAPWGLWCYRLDRQHALVGGAISNGGNLYAWLAENLRLELGPALEAGLAALEPDGHGLTFLPFLAGERNPGYARGATATITGLRWHTRPIEILRAGLEAVAYRLALIHELLAPRASPEAQVVASGAALLHSPAWAQIVADVLGRPIHVTAEAEASCRGAALLAAQALGLLRDPAEVAPPVGACYQPDPARHARYQEGLARHRRLYRALLG
ncbi:MAG: gluconokinase, partial [Anaerolineae bacterium]|nr:gluconokinase [Anaerolineae bacterium]